VELALAKKGTFAVKVEYDARFRESVSHLVLIDAPLQGSKLMDEMRGDPRGWHVGFHQTRDVTELLVQGRERASAVHDRRAHLRSERDFRGRFRHLRARLRSAGAMRVAFELYRAFEDDKVAVRRAVQDGGKLRTPTLCIGGATSDLGEWMPKMLDELVERGEHALVPRSGHWVPEENPSFLTDTLLRFL
jgi:pimeloyl-ACP methyl ester carboxylesterase